MNPSPLELALIELIKDKLIGIQKSEQIHKMLSGLDEKVLKMSNKEIDKVSKKVAPKVCRFYMTKKRAGENLSAEMINEKVKEELLGAI